MIIFNSYTVCCGIQGLTFTPHPSGAGRAAFTNSGVTGGIFQMAQVELGLPWLVERINATQPYFNSPKVTSFAMNISYFRNDNLTMEILGGSTVSFKYKFRNFRGEISEFAETSPALVETRCEEFVASQDIAIPPATMNSTQYYRNPNMYRWISPLFNDQFDSSGYIFRNATIQMCTSDTINFACFNGLCD